MSRLIVVSNRLPITVTKSKGDMQFKTSVGGLATGVGSLEMSLEQLWIGWPGITLGKVKAEQEEVESRLRSQNFYPVFLSKNDVEGYYYGFCNETIWPLFHYFLEFVIYNKSSWDTYKQVNEAFCDAIVKVAEPDDIIWVHDYHLMLLPKLLKEKHIEELKHYINITLNKMPIDNAEIQVASDKVVLYHGGVDQAMEWTERQKKSHEENSYWWRYWQALYDKLKGQKSEQ